MQLKVLKLSTVKLLKHSLRYTNALGDACFPKDNLPKLLDALGLLSREVFQAETSWVRWWSRHSKHKYDLTNVSWHSFFYQEGFRGSVLLFFWRLLSWHPATGTVSGIAFPLTDFSLCPLFLFPFFFSPFI